MMLNMWISKKNIRMRNFIINVFCFVITSLCCYFFIDWLMYVELHCIYNSMERIEMFFCVFSVFIFNVFLSDILINVVKNIID